MISRNACTFVELLIMFSLMLIAGIIFMVIPFMYEDISYYIRNEELRYSITYIKVPIYLGVGIALIIIGSFGILITVTIMYLQKKTTESYDFQELDFKMKYKLVFQELLFMFLFLLVAGIILCFIKFKYELRFYNLESEQNLSYDALNRKIMIHLDIGIFMALLGFFGILITSNQLSYDYMEIKPRSPSICLYNSE
ncbi:Hypothetical_protein [Hexamita inflata]|uniref:Hypothetical_protein n=1 Tax=Hexamita inflata TaxID=28002 RepID=A0AA86NUU8_9EUKA|nr:Hypothetical protein HINF_LOCUS14637 [Hexamita inflata]